MAKSTPFSAERKYFFKYLSCATVVCQANFMLKPQKSEALMALNQFFVPFKNPCVDVMVGH